MPGLLRGDPGAGIAGSDNVFIPKAIKKNICEVIGIDSAIRRYRAQMSGDLRQLADSFPGELQPFVSHAHVIRFTVKGGKKGGYTTQNCLIRKKLRSFQFRSINFHNQFPGISSQGLPIIGCESDMHGYTQEDKQICILDIDITRTASHIANGTDVQGVIALNNIQGSGTEHRTAHFFGQSHKLRFGMFESNTRTNHKRRTLRFADALRYVCGNTA